MAATLGGAILAPTPAAPAPRGALPGAPASSTQALIHGRPPQPRYDPLAGNPWAPLAEMGDSGEPEVRRDPRPPATRQQQQQQPRTRRHSSAPPATAATGAPAAVKPARPRSMETDV